AVTLQISNTPYVEAAVLAGGRLGWAIRKHVWNKLLPSISIVLANTIGIGLVSVAALSFLGIGIQPPEPVWGGILSADLGYLAQRPYAPEYPRLVMLFTVWQLNMLADAIRDVNGHSQVARTKPKQQKQSPPKQLKPVETANAVPVRSPTRLIPPLYLPSQANRKIVTL